MDLRLQREKVGKGARVDEREESIPIGLVGVLDESQVRRVTLGREVERS
jgi:hypothetical protein